MKFKALVLSAILPVTVMAIDKGESFKIDLSDLSSYDFHQIDQGLIRYEDSEKSIEISSGYYGLKRHISNLEDELANLNSENMKIFEYEFKYSNLIEEIESFKSDLTHFNKVASSENLKGTVTTGGCYPHITQTYYIYDMMWSIGLNVKSEYPMVPGPFPPLQTVNLHAVSTFFPGASYEQTTINTFVGGNIYGGVVVADQTSGYLGNASQLVPYKAVSIMSQPICFESITVTGNHFYSRGMDL